MQGTRPVSAGSLDVGDFALQVREWIERGIAGEPCTSIELWRQGDPFCVKPWPIDAAKLARGNAIDELIAAMVARAQRDADAYKGEPQVYTFRAFFGVGAKVPLESYSATLCGAFFGAPTAGGRSFPATHEGALALAMAHADESTRLALQGFREAFSTLQAQLAAAMAELKELRGERRQVWLDLQAVQSTKLEAERQAKADAREAEQWEQALQLFKVMLPSAVNRLTGTQLLPEVTHPLVEQFRSFFDGLKPEQLEVLGQLPNMTPQQGIALHDLLTKFLDEKDRKAALVAVATKAGQLAQGAQASRALTGGT